MAQKVWSGLFHRQHLITHSKLHQVQSSCVKQEFNSSKQALTANNRRLGLILLSIAIVFFIGIVMKRSLLG
ncbi:cytochrome oxidase small assembly protein [Polynucleobacter asymbioticus]|uniref:cytochrome oxidase small assembly protein n=1 Tax=Polynucleobacter asymbioticus TaxID=576611 RepID=UPI001AD8D8F8|nr:cytochrome oxidase small assembly protein [Polynucleobacter asymbioticus]